MILRKLEQYIWMYIIISLLVVDAFENETRIGLRSMFFEINVALQYNASVKPR